MPRRRDSRGRFSSGGGRTVTMPRGGAGVLHARGKATAFRLGNTRATVRRPASLGASVRQVRVTKARRAAARRAYATRGVLGHRIARSVSPAYFVHQTVSRSGRRSSRSMNQVRTNYALARHNHRLARSYRRQISRAAG